MNLTAKALRERANDAATIAATSNPVTAKAVRATLLHLADLLEEKPMLVVKAEPVAKRRMD